jgi:predicted nucleic acid-binding protein
MLVVDSSVWIDYARGIVTPQTDRLDGLLGSPDLAACDLVVAEVLQGAGTEREFNQLFQLFQAMPIITVSDEAIAVQAARNYRTLRDKGITVRKTIDTLIATRCIVDGHALLYSDRDFDPFVAHLGLVSGMGV